MKKYRYKFTNLIVALLILGIVVATACLSLNVFRFIKLFNKGIKPSVYHYLTLILICILTIGYIIVALSIFISSYYKITDKEVVLKWGVITNKIKLDDIKEVKLLLNKNKLHLVFSDNSFFIVNTNENWFDEFIGELKDKRPKINFIQISDDSTKDKI